MADAYGRRLDLPPHGLAHVHPHYVPMVHWDFSLSKAIASSMHKCPEDGVDVARPRPRAQGITGHMTVLDSLSAGLPVIRAVSLRKKV
jgi:hypothetical protein